MTCYRSKDNWHSYVKNSLNEAELNGLADHLTQCPECRKLVSVIQETERLLAKSRVTLCPPASLKLNVMMAIDKNRYKETSSYSFPQTQKSANADQRFGLNNWGLSMIAAGLLLLALNLTSLAPNFESGQFVELNSQIGKQLAHPFDKMRQAFGGVIVKIESK